MVHFEDLLGSREEQDKAASAGEAHEGNHRAAAEVVVPHSSGLAVNATQEEEEEAEERCVRGFDTDEHNEVAALVHSVVEEMEEVRWYRAATRGHHDGLLAAVQVVKIQA